MVEDLIYKSLGALGKMPGFICSKYKNEHHYPGYS